jgi:cytochrome c-type biogenesis protein
MEWAMETIGQLAEFQFSFALMATFFAGILTSFNPCMLGMATSITAFQDRKKQKNTFPIILTFMLSFSITLTMLGVVSSFFGNQVLEWNEQYGAMLYKLLAMIFILIGCYVVGLRLRHIVRWFPFTIVGFYLKQEKDNHRKPARPLVKAYALGTIFGLTPSPCTTPMVIAMLAYTTVTGSTMLGGLLLFVYGIGHSIPFLILGLMTGKVRRSRWMIRSHRVINKGLGTALIFIGLFFFWYDGTL